MHRVQLAVRISEGPQDGVLSMDAHEFMLRRSQYICVLSPVNARFSFLKQRKSTGRTKRFWIREYLKKREKYVQFHFVFRVAPFRQRILLSTYQDESRTL